MTDGVRHHRLRGPDRLWSRRHLLTVGAVAGSGLLAGGLAGCSSGGPGDDGNSQDKLKDKVENPPHNLKTKGFPIVSDPISVEFMTNHAPNTAKDYNKVACWKKYEKMTNIKVNWGPVPQDSLTEKRNLSLSGDDYPAGFYGNWLGVQEVEKYGSQGVFIQLNDLINGYMPNLKKLMDDNADIKQGVTFPDGSIYSMPLITDPDFTASRIGFKPWVRGDWLDKFDMDVPTTTDEYYHYLKMVKSKQPNGKGDTIPYGSSRHADQLCAALWGSFGIANRGNGTGYLDADPSDDSKVRFFPVTDGYKALMEYLHKLYSQGLIAKNIFSIDDAKAGEALKKGVYGSTVEIAPGSLRGGKAKNFVPTKSLQGPDGDHAYNNVGSSLNGLGNLVLTDRCEHPVAMARWADYFYSADGAKLQFMGVKGVSYTETSDGVEYVDKIKHPPKDKTQDEARKPYVTYQGGAYGPGVILQDYFKGSESSDESTNAAKLLKPDAKKVLKDAWPGFTFTEDEFEKLDSLSDDIEKYVDETRDKFISGDVKLSDWDSYVKKIKKMGLDDYMEIQQAAYDRYRKK